MALLNPASISLRSGSQTEEITDAAVELQKRNASEAVTEVSSADEQNEVIDSIVTNEVATESGSRTEVLSQNEAVSHTYNVIRKPVFDGPLDKVIVHKVPIEKITPQVHKDFIAIVTGAESLNSVADEEHRDVLTALLKGHEYEVVCDVNDEVLGQIDFAILHTPSKRLVLTNEQKDIVIDFAVERFKNDRYPVGGCLQLIQKNYVGFPSVIRLRNTLMERLKRLLSTDDIDCQTRYDGKIFFKCYDFDADTPTIEDQLIEVDHYEEYGNDEESRFVMPKCSSYKSVKQTSSLINSAIPDDQYDLLAKVLVGKVRVDEISDWLLREAIKARLTGDLDAEFWSQPIEFLPGGWRIRVRESGKVVPRKSEVDQIWHSCVDMMGRTHTQRQILAYLDERYVGISTKSRVKWVNRDVLLKAARVVFPPQQHFYGRKPMQYVQIDMVEMESSGYGSRCYNMALIVTDLFSHFVFGRALAEAPDSSLLVRHLMDIFGAFAPPEAYRTYSNHLIIEHVMSDIEKLFKIPIRNIGPGVMSHYTLRANIYRRAEEELGSRERWVEALPFAVIEYNQKPLDDLAMRISPFEIMFGRRPWKDCITPPWIENIDGDTLFEVNGSEGSMNGQGSVYDVLACDTARRSGSDNSLQSNQTNFGELSENRAKIALATPQSQAKYNEHGQLIDPGTGYLFDAGDHVYMRNLAFSEALNKRRNHVPRYLRATIAEVDLSNADFTYRVYYWNEVPNVDSVPPDVWPTEECISTWVSPFDVTASTPELARKRSVVKRRELLSQCKCGYDYCELQYSDLCPFKLSQSCCKRLNVNCACHMNIGKHQEKERQALCEDQMQEDHAKETLWNVTQEDQKKEGPFTLELNIEEPRWIFLNGRLVEYIPKCCKRKRREPQEIDEINEAEVKECQNEESDSATSQSDDELQSEIEGKSARVVPFQSLIHQQKRKCVIGSMSLKHISRDSARIPSYARAQVARAARVHEVARNGANETSESQKPRKQPMEHCSSLYGRVEAANISPKKLERRKRSPSRASHITQRFSPSPNHH